MADKPKVVDAKHAETIIPNLPPAGADRDEELARRKDELEQAAEELAAQIDVHSFSADAEVFKPDREILQRMDMMYVSNAQSEYEYSWVNYRNQEGSMVWQKKSLGWEIVSGPDPEAKEAKDTDGTRRIGDVILMRIPKDRKKELDEMDELKRLRSERSTSARLQELGQKYSGSFKVREFTNPADIRRASAQQTAGRLVDDMIRSGSVPGMPAPGRRR